MGQQNKGHLCHMAKLQPNIVIIDGRYQNRGHTGTVGTQRIREDLITDQSAGLSRQAKFM